MTKRISLIISWLCLIALIVQPLAAIWLLFNLDTFAEIILRNLNLAIIWPSVENQQIVLAWIVSVINMSIGLIGLFFLRRSFKNFSKGKLFDLKNTRDLRRFSIFVLLQGLISPIYYTFLSVILSWNHPEGEKMLSFMFGSNEFRSIALALIFWVICDLLVEAEKLKNENQQFI